MRQSPLPPPPRPVSVCLWMNGVLFSMFTSLLRAWWGASGYIMIFLMGDMLPNSGCCCACCVTGSRMAVLPIDATDSSDMKWFVLPEVKS